jgi:hypothetical protein
LSHPCWNKELSIEIKGLSTSPVEIWRSLNNCQRSCDYQWSNRKHSYTVRYNQMFVLHLDGEITHFIIGAVMAMIVW